MGAKSCTVYKNTNFIHLLLSQFLTVIFQFRTSNSIQNYHNFLRWRRNIIVISKRSKGLLAQCALFSLRQLGMLSMQVYRFWHHFIKPMHKISLVIFRQSIYLASPHVSICYLFIMMKSRTEFSTSCNTYSTTFPTHTWWLPFFFSVFFVTEQEEPLWAQPELGLNKCVLVVKACLKPAYNYGLNVVWALYYVF